ncbi:hypothetical protein GCM10022275_32200 [Tessaracoccus defluvii]
MRVTSQGPGEIVSETLYRDESTPWLSVYSDEVTAPNGARFRTRHVEVMGGQPGAVCIALQRDRVLMADLWRPAIGGALSFEFPRGMGEPGETIIQTALRELHEETGVDDVVSAREVGVFHADTGLLSNLIGVVEIIVAEDRLVVGPELQSARWTPVAVLDAAVAAGQIRDGITLAAWALWTSARR